MIAAVDPRFLPAARFRGRMFREDEGEGQPVPAKADSLKKTIQRVQLGQKVHATGGLPSETASAPVPARAAGAGADGRDQFSETP